MNPREQGFLLLTSRLGNPERKPLTTAQLRTLSLRAAAMEMPMEQRDLDIRDLTALGCSPAQARHILGLLEEQELLAHYLRRGKQAGCVPITRVSPRYPAILRKRLGTEAPGCLWAKGNTALLEQPAIALVGSRELRDSNLEFAREAGRQTALQGHTLVSGNARGADRESQNAAREAGGSVISIVADELARRSAQSGILYLSEDDFDAPFSTPRALSRNRCIHTLGKLVLVAQAALQSGGTWDGTSKNLRFGWSPVYCFNDGSEAALVLEQMGAVPIDISHLADLNALPEACINLFDQ